MIVSMEWMRFVRRQLPHWAQLMRLHRPVGIGLLLWPTAWALWVAADGLPSPRLMLIFGLGVILTRSAGCIVNDYMDRELDAHVLRTRDRPLPAGTVRPKEALILALLLAMAAFALVLLTNSLTVWLAVLAAVLAVIYPLAKHFTHLPQLLLGCAFSMGIPMAFAAQSEEVPRIAWLLFMANLLWTIAYDTEYALVDRRWDRRLGLKSTAILFGEQAQLMIGILQGGFIICLLLAGEQHDLGIPYYAAVGAAALVCGWQQWLMYQAQVHGPQAEEEAPRDSLQMQDDEAACFAAFRSNNLVGLLVLAGLVLDTLTLGSALNQNG